MASGGDLINGLFWFVILVLISWWVAAFCFIPYIIVSVLTPCLNPLRDIGDILLAGVKFPSTCSENMGERSLAPWLNGQHCGLWFRLSWVGDFSHIWLIPLAQGLDVFLSTYLSINTPHYQLPQKHSLVNTSLYIGLKSGRTSNLKTRLSLHMQHILHPQPHLGVGKCSRRRSLG